jgi:hypothetical protein
VLHRDNATLVVLGTWMLRINTTIFKKQYPGYLGRASGTEFTREKLPRIIG